MMLQRFLVPAVSTVIGTSCGLAAAGPVSVFVSSGDTDSVLAYDGETGAFLMSFASGGGLDEPEGISSARRGSCRRALRPERQSPLSIGSLLVNRGDSAVARVVHSLP